jgi:hypothetical protein
MNSSSDWTIEQIIEAYNQYPLQQYISYTGGLERGLAYTVQNLQKSQKNLEGNYNKISTLLQAEIYQLKSEIEDLKNWSRRFTQDHLLWLSTIEKQNSEHKQQIVELTYKIDRIFNHLGLN